MSVKTTGIALGIGIFGIGMAVFLLTQAERDRSSGELSTSVETGQLSTPDPEWSEPGVDARSEAAAEVERGAAVDEPVEEDTKAGTLLGRLFDDLRRPLVGRVGVWPADASREAEDLLGLSFGIGRVASFGQYDAAPYRAETDSDGNFEVTDIAVGTYDVVAFSDGFQPHLEVQLDIVEDEITTVEFSLEPGLRIDGIVVDPTGRPVVGARVRASSELVNLGGGGTFVISLGEPTTEASIPIETTTGPGGRFVLEGLATGQHSLRASSDAWASSPVANVAAGSEAITLTLRQGGGLSGVVLAPSGAPLEGAVVNFLSIGEFVRNRTETGSDGRFEMDGLVPGTAVLTIRATGFPELSDLPVEVEAGAVVSGLEFTLDEGATLQGRVVDAAGNAIEDSTVTVRPVSEDRSGGARELALFASGTVRSATTDADGGYELRGLPMGASVDVTADHSKWLEGDPVLVVMEGPSVEVPDIVLKPGAVVRGRVTDATTDMPIAGASVRIAEARDEGAPVDPFEALGAKINFGGASLASHSMVGGPSGPSGKTDTNGTYSIEPVEPGNYQVVVECPGYAVVRSAAFSVSGSGRFDFDVAVGDGERIRGVVVDPQGRPVAGARIDLKKLPVRFMDGAAAVRTTSQIDGAFEFRGLEAVSYRIDAKARGFSPARVDVDASVGRVIEVALFEPGRIVGTVRSLATSLPVEEFEVNAQLDFSSSSFRTGLDFSDISLRGPATYRDPDGEFVIEDLKPGRYTVTISAGNHVSDVRMVELEAGRDVVLDVALELGGAIAGRVVDDRGRPIDGATVTQSGRPGAASASVGFSVAVSGGSGGTTFFNLSEGSVRTDTDGNFILDGIADGEAEFQVDAEGFVGKTLEGVKIRSGETTRVGDTVLERGATLTGVVVDDTGDPVANAVVMIQGASANRPEIVVSNEEGRFSKSGLGPGTYTVSSRGGSGGGISFGGGDDADGGVSVTFQPGETRDVTVRVGN